MKIMKNLYYGIHVKIYMGLPIRGLINDDPYDIPQVVYFIFTKLDH